MFLFIATQKGNILNAQQNSRMQACRSTDRLSETGRFEYQQK